MTLYARMLLERIRHAEPAALPNLREEADRHIAGLRRYGQHADADDLAKRVTEATPTTKEADHGQDHCSR